MQMVQQAHARGITTLYATPHAMNGVYNVTPDEILKQCARLSGQVRENHVPITILPGAEIRLTHDLIALYDKGALMTLNNQGTHLLLELPPLFIMDGVLRILRQLADRGVTAIIAHPERNPAILKNPASLARLLQAKALMQITAASLTGGFGLQVMKLSEAMIDKGAVSFIGSDIHPGRPWAMADAGKKIARTAGKETARHLFLKNPANLLASAAKGTTYAG